MAEPISDDEIERLRRQTIVMEDVGYSTGTYRVVDIVRLLARLDVAESRAVELQREVERLSILTPAGGPTGLRGE